MARKRKPRRSRSLAGLGASPLRVCALPGPAWVASRELGWKRTTLAKTACGALVRITSIKAGDIRMATDVAILRVRRREFAVPAKNVRIMGGYRRPV